MIDQNEFFDKRIASKDVRGYYLIKKGEFAYNKSTSVDAPFGAIKRLDKYKNGVLSTLYILFKVIDDTSTCSDYLVTYYFTDLWHKGIQSIAAEGARNHGLLNIAPNDFFETMLSIPLNVSEQKKVGGFFISLDHLITLHQSKFFGDILKTIASYTLYWEQRKLGEMYTQLVERNIELLPFKKILSVSTMTYKGDGNGAAEESLSSYKRLRVGDIAFEGHTSKDFRYGRFVLNDTGDGIMSPRFSALRPISVMPIKFWKYYIHYEPIMKKILVNSTKSGTMMNELVVEEFLKEILLVPEEHEQQKIGRFFNGIDHLITLHQSKLEKLQKIKKSMLECMFI